MNDFINHFGWPLIWAVFLLFSLGAGAVKERTFSGFIWGVFLGPIGFLVVLLVLPDLKKQRLAAEQAKEADAALLRYQAARR